MTRRPGELPPEEEAFLGIERSSEQDEARRARLREDDLVLREAGLKNLMRQPWFRAWIMETLSALGTFANIHASGPNGAPDPLATQFHLGQKAAGWGLWTYLDDLAPELAALMRREAKTSGR